MTNLEDDKVLSSLQPVDGFSAAQIIFNLRVFLQVLTEPEPVNIPTNPLTTVKLQMRFRKALIEDVYQVYRAFWLFGCSEDKIPEAITFNNFFVAHAAHIRDGLFALDSVAYEIIIEAVRFLFILEPHSVSLDVPSAIMVLATHILFEDYRQKDSSLKNVLATQQLFFATSTNTSPSKRGSNDVLISVQNKGDLKYRVPGNFGALDPITELGLRLQPGYVQTKVNIFRLFNSEWANKHYKLISDCVYMTMVMGFLESDHRQCIAVLLKALLRHDAISKEAFPAEDVDRFLGFQFGPSFMAVFSTNNYKMSFREFQKLKNISDQAISMLEYFVRERQDNISTITQDLLQFDVKLQTEHSGDILSLELFYKDTYSAGLQYDIRLRLRMLCGELLLQLEEAK